LSEHRVFKCTIKLISPLETHLEADIIWGNMMWALRYISGKDRVEEVIEAYSSVPPLIISDGFPAGYLPAPLRDINPYKLDDIVKKSISEGLRFSRIEKVINAILYTERFPYHIVSTIAGGERTLLDFIKDVLKCNLCPLLLISLKKMKKTKGNIKKLISNNCKIERCFFLNGNSSTDCFCIVREFLDKPHIYPLFYKHCGNAGEKWDIYILSSMDKALLEELLNFIGDNGYGRNASRGRGVFSVEDFKLLSGEERPDKYNGNENGFMTLASSYIPTAGEIDHVLGARYKLLIKTGKLGGHWASVKNFCKYPLIMCKAGSIFPASPGIKNFWGQLKKEIHPTRKEVVHYGWAFPVWGNFFEER